MAVCKAENHQGLNSKADSPVKQRHMERQVPFFFSFFLTAIFSSLSPEQPRKGTLATQGVMDPSDTYLPERRQQAVCFAF